MKKQTFNEEAYREYVDKHIMFVNQMQFAKSGTNVATSSNSSTKTSRDNILGYLQNPMGRRTDIQKVSKEFYLKNGLYQRIINYMSYTQTYDHYIYPSMSLDKLNAKDKAQQFMYESALYLDKMNIHYLAPFIVEQLLLYGELYLYKIQDTKSIAYQVIPPEYCRIHKYENNVGRFEINTSKLDEAKIIKLGLPEEFITIVNGNNDNLKDVMGREKDSQQKNWVEVSERGVAFCVGSMQDANGLPYFMTMFEELTYLYEIKNKQEEILDLDNLRLLHHLIPTDEEGDFLFDENIVLTYHNAIKRNLPKGVSVATTPMKLQAVNLNSGQNSIIDTLVEKAINRAYDSSGTTRAIFNSDKPTTSILEKSVMVDSMVSTRILRMIENYINYELTKNVNSVYVWKFAFLETTVFNENDKQKAFRDNLAVGGSRLMFLASTGMTPLEAIATLTFERNCNIDDLLIPLQTSYTMSSDSSNSEGGAPEKETSEMTEEGEKSQDKV